LFLAYKILKEVWNEGNCNLKMSGITIQVLLSKTLISFWAILTSRAYEQNGTILIDFGIFKKGNIIF